MVSNYLFTSFTVMKKEQNLKEDLRQENQRKIYTRITI